MKCPKCGENRDGVANSFGEKTIIWRERICKACGHKWTTSEMEDEPVGITIAGLRTRARGK